MTTKKKSTKTTARKKPAAKKPASKTQSTTAKSPVHKASQTALKLIDDAASLLRKSVTTGADMTEKAQEAAQKRAHGMVSKAHGLLGNILDKGTSELHSLIGRPRKSGK